MLAVHRGLARVVVATVAVALVGGALAAPAGEPRVVARIAVGTAASQPCMALAAYGAIWVTNFGDATVQRVDPRRNRAVGKPIPVGSRPCPIAAGAGSLWVGAFGRDRVDRIDPRRRKVVRRIAVGRLPFDVLFAARAVWVSDGGSGTVSRIDPRRNRVVAKVRVGGRPAGLSFAAGSVWVANGPRVQRIDPATNAVTSLEVGTVGAAWFAATDTAVWVADTGSNTVVRIDPATNAAVARIPAGQAPVDGAIGPDGLVWIPNLQSNDVTVIDPATNSVVRTVPVGPGPFVLTVGFGDVWAPAYNGRNVWRIRVAPSAD